MKLTDLSITLAVVLCAAWVASCTGNPSTERASSPPMNQSQAVQSAPAPQAPEINADASAVSAAPVAAEPLATPAAAAPAPAKGKGDAAKGKTVFEQCAICHNVDTSEDKVGPSLKGLFKKEKLKNGHPANEASIRAVIKSGGNGMPGYDGVISAEDMDHLIAYLKTI